MRTNTATIHLVQLAKPNQQGLHPIVIRAHYKGMGERRTGIAVPKNMWNPRTCTIRSSYPNAAQLNITIHQLYDEMVQRRTILETNHRLTCVQDLLSDDTPTSTDYETLVETIIKERALSVGSAKLFRSSFHILQEFMGRKSFDLTLINEDKVRAYGRWLKNKGLKNSTIVCYQYDVCRVWKYAVTNKMVDANDDPFLRYNPRHHYKANITKKALDYDDYLNLEDKLGTMLRANRNDMSVFSQHTSDEFALAMYVLGYRFGGLAFVDLAGIKKSQLTTKKVGKGIYFFFNDVYRKKTTHHVPVMAYKDMITGPLMDYYMSLPGEYLIPMDRSSRGRFYTISTSLNRHLRKVTGMDITYYSCRHTIASAFMNQENANPLTLASIMGRSVSGIFRYVKELNSEEDIIKARAKLGI